MKSLLSRLILRVKVFAYRLLFILQTCLVRIARVIPGVPRVLGIPDHEIPNLETWVNGNHVGQNLTGDAPTFISFAARSVPRRNRFPAGLLDERPELQAANLTFEDPFVATLPSACMLGPE